MGSFLHLSEESCSSFLEDRERRLWVTWLQPVPWTLSFLIQHPDFEREPYPWLPGPRPPADLLVTPLHELIQSDTPYKVQGNLDQLAIVIEGASLTAFGCVNSRLASYHAGTVVPEWVSSFYSLIFIFLFLTLSSFSLKCILYNVKCTNTKWNFYICTCLTTTQTKIYSASPQVLSYSLQVISPKGNLT